jgi:hypothetical protein
MNGTSSVAAVDVFFIAAAVASGRAQYAFSKLYKRFSPPFDTPRFLFFAASSR